MSLAPGTRFGSYEVAAQIGVGGMGEVYRARDIKLNRDVALKVLPDSFANDPDRLARFQREAQVLASLNHPNIAAIYGVEEVGNVRALVMELVDGPTLAELISGGAPRALDIDDALRIATQIAEALGAAHDQGVIHRDLKPANIKVKADGTVKVLDFGLAKATEPSVASSHDVAHGASQSPTITTPAMTQMGMVLGTAAYMSPEQAKGRPADKRSDVWAFGCVFYEMLTGQRAFAEDDVSETLAAVLKSEPDWTRIPSDVPQAIRTLIQRCLVKDRRQRVADISAATFVLRELGNLGTRTVTVGAAAPRSRWQRLLPPLAAAAVTAAIVAAGAWALRPAAGTPAVARFSFPLPERVVLSGTRQVLAISRDGTRMVYAADSRMYMRSIDELEPHAISGTETASAGGLLNPMFSPDGEYIGFFPQGDGISAPQTKIALRRIPITGGAASTIGTMGPTLGASWSAEGVLVGQADGIVLVPTNGAMRQIVKTDQDERIYGPWMLPGGRTVIFTVAKTAAITADGGWDKAQVVAQSLTDGTRKVLIDGGSDGRYLPSGHLLYGVSGTMFAAPFDAETVTVTGAAVPVLVGVRRATGRYYPARHLAVSDTGTLIYVPGPATTSAATALLIGDSRVPPELLKIPPGEYAHPRVSPDGRMVAVVRGTGQESEISTYDLSGATELRRLTFGGNNGFPVWSGDSKRIAFQSARDGGRAIFAQSADGSSVAEPLTKPVQGKEHRPESWSRDGSRLLFSIVKESKFTLWVLTLATKKSEPFGRVESAEPLSASFSPDGRWVVYASSPVAGGMLSPNRGIFVQPFPATGQLHQAPKKFLDFHPVWAPDGKSIYYIPGAARPAVLVPVTTSLGVAFGTAVDIPRGPQPGVISTDVRGYDILPDGRFISLAPASGEGPASPSSSEIRVVLNWFEELKRLSPTK